MESNVHVIRGIFQSKAYIQKVSEQEQVLIKPILLKTSLLVGMSLLLSTLLGLAGYHTEEISKLVNQTSMKEIEALQFYHVLGLGLKGLILPILYVLLSSSLSYLFMREIKWGVLVHIHLLFVWFLLLNQAIELGLFYFFGIPSISSPLSLGIVGQILLDHPLFIHILSHINLVYLGGVLYITLLLKSVTSRKKLEIGLIVVGIHLLLAIIAAGISVINIDSLLGL
ncbi:hypothetical protein [Bacillus pinisoli]|uniref:hypothetical protein n=1 Tax=Bacillus pinisoli TaxID=2901866 RepID=UPI001FF20E0D|nr:hypothetical protein [Bacillus pinisoli]